MSDKFACAYVRVSTSQQAQHDLSIPDQLNQIRAAAAARGLTIIAEFVEPGASARTDQRPVFQEMMGRALAKPPEFRTIMVHSMSRLFRDGVDSEVYRRKLERNGVEMISTTQDFGSGDGAIITRRIMALMDEMQSLETSKHVRRTMLENARQNFWNGSRAPLGYNAVVAEIRGHKHKKRLEIDPEGAETIRLIFRLYIEGDGISGPLGIKNITKYLNARGFRTPLDNAFHSGFVQKLLTNEVYAGRAYYNVRDTKRGVVRPKEEWIAVEVPPIVSEDTFQRVQSQLALRQPKMTPGRLINSPVLLTGIVRCGGCNAAMRRETGKGGRFHYYRCSTLKRTGSCNGRPTVPGISATQLDEIVLDRIAEQLLTPERVKAIISEVAAKRDAGIDQATTTLRQLREQRSKTAKKISNLMTALADGIVEGSDTFKATMKDAEADAKRINDLIGVQERILSSQMKDVTLEEAAEFAGSFRDKLLTSAPALKKRIIRSFVAEVIVTEDEIIIHGEKSDLAEIVTGGLNND